MSACNVCEVDEEIEVCTMHSAAPTMKSALQKAQRYLDQDSCNDDPNAPDPECVVCAVHMALAEANGASQ